MKLTYDSKHNIAYLRLHPKKAQVDTIRVSDELNVDMAPDGKIYGIELLNANEQIATEDDGNLVVINEVLGHKQEMPLTVREKPVKYGAGKKKDSI